MMITAHSEAPKVDPPTQAELEELWNLMVMSLADEYKYLAPAKRLVSNRAKVGK